MFNISIIRTQVLLALAHNFVSSSGDKIWQTVLKSNAISDAYFCKTMI